MPEPTPSATDHTPAKPLALVCSVAVECAELLAALVDAREAEVGRKPAWEGTLDGVAVLLLPAGMGKVNAAHGATALLEARRVRGVLGFGIGGAYPGSGLELCDVALASAAIYGDEGVDAPGGWISTEGIGIPLVDRPGLRVFNEFVLDADRVRTAAAALGDAGLPVKVGPFVTLSSCSGTAARGAELARRFAALCEGMEGAALAHVCALYEVPFLELRAVSNHVEDRDLSRWSIRYAALAAQRAARIAAASWT
jgi:futalosine hydrolase